ncbi:glycerol-3-phosphate dehydrogenase [Parasphingorhabdus sp. DH2-15]|uniref:glycerol-3-phosphate dehydrogenase n=1 Tax=Parasphingorhabdus sp. DH2-15 TaxID=3444112 RepID=UPI003F687AD8
MTNQITTEYDLLIIGGGINGTAIARDAAGRGLSVLLCEKDDLARHTSSASTKLVHGGLRYLEYYEFKLVRESLKEREVMLRSAPHIIWPLRFVLPYDKTLRPAWMLRAGLFLYDYMGGRKLLPPSKRVSLSKGRYANILHKDFTFGFEYSDCWVEDARLVVLNAVAAKEKGADIAVGAKVCDLKSNENGFTAIINHSDGQEQTVHAKGIVNAAGPWVEEVLQSIKPGRNDNSLRLVKGSHIVVPKLFDDEHCYTFQNGDGRVVFAIPYEQDYTLIGTTDVPHDEADHLPEISADEISYLCDAASEYFLKTITPDDVAWTYSGVRPLYDDKAADASAVTRDYVLSVEELAQGAPFMSVYGGKITTARKLAEHAMEQLADFYPQMGDKWTREESLPGGDIANADFDGFLAQAKTRYPWLPVNICHHLARAYGTRIHILLQDMASLEDMGQCFGNVLTEAEIRYLINHEFARSGEDIMWRRSKLGLHMTQEQRAAANAATQTIVATNK